MTAALPTPIVLARAEHPVSRKQISKNALRVLQRLIHGGHEAYLVGGGVRDLLLGREPKDFDIATSARPETVRALFRSQCRLIGRRFVLAHVHFGAEIIEVATFRALGEGPGRRTQTHDGRLVSDNVYGTLPEDALRRDFTINALYYNPSDFTVLDFHAGVEDLRQGTLRIIGDPETRCREDPVRMLRAVRFAAKLGFRIDPQCEATIHALAPLLNGVPPARLYEENLKLFMGGFGLEAFEKLRHYGLFAQLFPLTEASLTQQRSEFPLTLLAQGLSWVDQCWQQGNAVSPYLLFALLLWEPVRRLAGQVNRNELAEAAEQVFMQQARTVIIPARIAAEVRVVWYLQVQLEHHAKPVATGKHPKPALLVKHALFAEAQQLLALRAQAGEVDASVVLWWEQFTHSLTERSDPASHAKSVLPQPPSRPPSESSQVPQDSGELT